jgi:hypothetical protein
MSTIEKTEPKVFIIESLTFKNEDMNLFEGHIISNILQLSNLKKYLNYSRKAIIDIYMFLVMVEIILSGQH